MLVALVVSTLGGSRPPVAPAVSVLAAVHRPVTPAVSTPNYTVRRMSSAPAVSAFDAQLAGLTNGSLLDRSSRGPSLRLGVLADSVRPGGAASR